MVSLWSFAAGMLKQTVQPAAAPACLTRFWRDWECSLGNRLCFFFPSTYSLRLLCRVVDSLLSSLHPSTVCVCVCVWGGWVLTGIFLHLLILSPHSFSEHRNRRKHTSTHQYIHSLSAPILPFFSFLSPFIFIVLPFAGFFAPPPTIFVHFDPPHCSLSWVVMLIWCGECTWRDIYIYTYIIFLSWPSCSYWRNRK